MTTATASTSADLGLGGLSRELERQLNTKRDLRADTRLVSFSTDGFSDAGDDPHPPAVLNIDLTGGAESFGLTRHAHSQVASHLGIHQKLYDRLLTDHPGLFEHLTNGLFQREPAKRFVRILDGNVRAFLSDRYRRRDNYDLLSEAVVPALRDFPGEIVFRACELTETRMYVKVSLPQFEREVTPRVGDVINGGVIIKNSEVGAGALGVYPYTVVLDCTNGMVHTEYGRRSVHTGRRTGGDDVEAYEFYTDETLALDDAAYFAKTRDLIRGILNETVFDAIVADMRELAGIRLDSAPDKTVELLTERHRFTEGESSQMLSALIDGGDLSAWGFVNAITRTARDHGDADRRVELETLAGKLTTDRAWAADLARAS